jgi:hypothetical protein
VMVVYMDMDDETGSLLTSSPTILSFSLILINVYITIHWLHRMDIFGYCYIHI